MSQTLVIMMLLSILGCVFSSSYYPIKERRERSMEGKSFRGAHTRKDTANDKRVLGTVRNRTRRTAPGHPSEDLTLFYQYYNPDSKEYVDFAELACGGSGKGGKSGKGNDLGGVFGKAGLGKAGAGKAGSGKAGSGKAGKGKGGGGRKLRGECLCGDGYGPCDDDDSIWDDALPDVNDTDDATNPSAGSNTDDVTDPSAGGDTDDATNPSASELTDDFAIDTDDSTNQSATDRDTGDNPGGDPIPTNVDDDLNDDGPIETIFDTGDDVGNDDGGTGDDDSETPSNEDSPTNQSVDMVEPVEDESEDSPSNELVDIDRSGISTGSETVPLPPLEFEELSNEDFDIVVPSNDQSQEEIVDP